jgi:hypothetical protein
LKTRSVDAGYFANSAAGRTGRLSNSPPQFGHAPRSSRSAHPWQNVHSNEQIRASKELGGKSALQRSQLGLSFSMMGGYAG